MAKIQIAVTQYTAKIRMAVTQYLMDNYPLYKRTLEGALWPKPDSGKSCGATIFDEYVRVSNDGFETYTNIRYSDPDLFEKIAEVLGPPQGNEDV